MKWSVKRDTKSNFEVKLRAQDTERKAQSAEHKVINAERKAQSSEHMVINAERKVINALWDGFFTMGWISYVTVIHVSYC